MLANLYGTNQSYQNPSWLRTGQQYTQTADVPNIAGAYQKSPAVQGPSNGMVTAMNSPSSTIQTPGGSLPINGPTAQPSMWNGTWDPNNAPMFTPDQFSYTANTYGGSGGWYDANGNLQGGFQEAGPQSGQAASGKWSTPIGGFDQNNVRFYGGMEGNQDPNGFNLQIKNGQNTGMVYQYTKDPTTGNWVPKLVGQQAMGGNTAYGSDFWMPLALTVGAPLAAYGAAAGGLTSGTGAGMAGEFAASDAALAGGAAGAAAPAAGGAAAGGSTALSTPAYGSATPYVGAGAEAGPELAGTLPTGAGPTGIETGGATAGTTLAETGPESAGTLPTGAGPTNVGPGGSSSSFLDWLKGGNAARSLVTGGGNGSQTNGGQNQMPPWLQAIAAWYSQNRMNNYGGDLMGMYSRMEQNAQPYLQQLNASYQNPDSYFQSPEYQALQRLEENRLNRQAGATGRLGNDIDRAKLLQDFAAQNIDKYRSGLRQSVSDLYGNAARYANLYQAGSTARNSSGAPWFALAGQAAQNIPWQDLINGSKEAWDKYGGEVSDWFSSWFG